MSNLLRGILLKGRTSGASTYIEARYNWLTTTMTCRERLLTLTHDTELTNKLFALISDFLENNTV
jgi:hypothetical protein